MIGGNGSMLPRFPNPARDWYGAPAGALVGGLASSVIAMAALVLAKGADVDLDRDPTGGARQVAAVHLVNVFGSVVGAYIGASPHQKVAAAVGTAIAAGAVGAAHVAMEATEHPALATMTQGARMDVVTWGVPALGALVGAQLAGGTPAIPRS